jgi:hypothetical protein
MNGTSREELSGAGKSRKTVCARSLLCYWTAGDLRISMTSLSARLNMSVNSLSQSVARGKMLAKKHGDALT